MEFVTHCITRSGNRENHKSALGGEKIEKLFFSITKVQMKPVVELNESKLINKNKEIID